MTRTNLAIRVLVLAGLLIGLLAPPIPALAQAGVVTLDGAVSTATANTVSTVNIAHTTGTGANRLLLVGVSWNCGSTNRTISSVTFSYGEGPDVVSLTAVRTQQASGTNLRYAAIYSLLDPPSGQAGTVTITFSGSVSNGIVAGAANFAGVDQTTPLGTDNGANGSSTAPSVTLTGLDSNELVFDTLFQGASGETQTVTPGDAQTGQWNAFVGNTRAAASTEQAASGSVTMSWTAASSSIWAIAAVPINPAPGGVTHTLTVAVDPAGGGTTNPSAGVHTYAENTVVDVTATPAAGYTFDHWEGACTGSGACQVTMDADKTVTAYFTAQQYTLTVNVAGNGSVTKNPDQAFYLYGASVDLTAVPAGGWLFSGWSGDLSGGATQQTLVMDGDKTVTATFVEQTPGAVVLDGAYSSATADGVSVLSFPHTTGTGTDRLTLVGVSANSYGTVQTISSVTFTPDGGSAIALNLVGNVENEAGRLAAIYSLLNPASGTHGTVTITFSGSVGNGIAAGAANFAGVDQGDPFDDFASAIGTNETPTVNVTTAGQNELVFDTVFLGAATIGTLTAGADQTSLWDGTIDRVRSAASTEQATAGSVTMSWTVAGGADSRYWAIGAVPINPTLSAACYALTLSHTGQGSDPVADPSNSPGCSSGQYIAGASIALSGAVPDSGWQISGWTGTDNNTSTADVNTLTMPSAAHAAAVNYTEIPPTCYALTVGHTGQGSDPLADPSNSTGCSSGQYIAGELINFSGAVPTTGWQISAWSGTDDDLSTAGSNTLTMPAGSFATAVHYTQICYALSLDHTGQGSNPVASPTASASCESGFYVTGESISLSGAVPAAGWQISSWTGTNNDASTANTNTATMPSGPYAVAVNYLRTLGDVNLDGAVDSGDALVILSTDVGIDTSAYCPMNCGDANADGQVNSTDALIILTYDAGLTVLFPVGAAGCPATVTPPPGCGVP